MKTKPAQYHCPAGFSLLELLAVMSIMAVLIGICVPAALHITNGVTVNGAGQMIQSQMSLNRQLAIARNCTVEMRFYEVPSAAAPAEKYFSVFQTWIYDSSGANAQPLGKLMPLPRNAVIDAKAASGTSAATQASSTLIDYAPVKGTQVLPGMGSAALDYRAFSYRGNGAANLSLGGPTVNNTWFITARLQRDQPVGALPKNFYTVQVDPLTGQPRAFRP